MGPTSAPSQPAAGGPATVFLTSSAGDAMAESKVELTATATAPVKVTVHLDRERQRFLGVGGSLTQASAAALKAISPEKRAEVLEAYFGPNGAGYALVRTHIASSDFTEYSYTYAPSEAANLEDFSIEEDRKNGLLSLILDAQAVPGADFKLISSPWSPPPWMKDTGEFYVQKERRGGSLLTKHYETFARYFVKYIETYAAEGVPVWAITPINEPMGNAGNWESMEMTPEEQRDFIRVLGPQLRSANLDTRILIFDQNRVEMPQYTQVIFTDEAAGPYTYGTAVHWYNSTFKVYEDILESERALYPDKVIIHSEGTIDSVSSEASCDGICVAQPCGCEKLYAWWLDDAWYWKKEATDWGWDWAPDKSDHPKYAPAFRYARDLVVGIGHRLDGWVDWNIVLDKRGGPNHVSNFCLAPVMVDGETDTVYYTPLFWIVKQVSKYSRPGGVVLEISVDGPEGLHAMAIRNPDGRVAVHVFNESGEDLDYAVTVGDTETRLRSPHASLQTMVVDAE